jgi:hypothetical protein
MIDANSMILSGWLGSRKQVGSKIRFRGPPNRMDLFPQLSFDSEN